MATQEILLRDGQAKMPRKEVGPTLAMRCGDEWWCHCLTSHVHDGFLQKRNNRNRNIKNVFSMVVFICAKVFIEVYSEELQLCSIPQVEAYTYTTKHNANLPGQ